MSGNLEYSFCPECGSLMSGNVCSACGATRQEEVLFNDFNTSSVYTTGNLNAGSEPLKEINERKNTKGKIPVAVWILSGILGLLLLLMCVFVVVAIFFAIFTANSMKTTTNISSASSYQGTSAVPETEEESEDSQALQDDDSNTTQNAVVASKLQGIKKVDLTGVDVQSYLDAADLYSDEIGMPLEMYLSYFDIFPYAHVNVPREEITELYYNTWGDSFDHSCGYSVEGHSINFIDEENDINYSAYIGYYQLIGEHIPNVDELNKQMYEQALNPLIAQLAGLSQYNVSEDFTLYVEPFITYNDEKKMSVIYLVYAYYDGYQEQLYLVSQNIDLVAGEMLSTSDLIQLEDSFAAEFRERSLKQNGSFSEGLEQLSDAELVDFLLDDETNILFFSPCGLEVGVNYLQNNSAWGWLTVTLREMSDVLTDDSYDFIKAAKSTWAAPNGEVYDLEEALQSYYDYLDEKYGLIQQYDDFVPEDDSDDSFILIPEQGETGDL